MKYMIIMLTVCTLVGCVPRNDEKVLIKQTSTDTTETLVYKNHIVQKHCLITDTPVKSVVIEAQDPTSNDQPQTKSKNNGNTASADSAIQ